MGPGKLVCHMQNLSYTYDAYLHGKGTKRIVCHNQKSGVQWSVICKFACLKDFCGGLGMANVF